MTVNDFEAQYHIPPGGITMWADLLSNIPPGFILCDGANGTPNLINRFAQGVSTSTTDPGATGGQNTLKISTTQLPAHSHSATIDSVGGHKHTPYIWDYGNYGSTYEKEYSNGTNFESNSNGGHSHNLNVGSTGGNGGIDNRPPYQEVAFIQRG